MQKMFSVRKVLIDEHLFIMVYGKSILCQYQSLIIFSQSVDANSKVLVLILLF